MSLLVILDQIAMSINIQMAKNRVYNPNYVDSNKIFKVIEKSDINHDFPFLRYNLLFKYNISLMELITRRGKFLP